MYTFSFFQNQMDNIISRVKVLNENENTIKELDQVKIKIKKCLTDIEKNKIYEEITNKFSIPLWVKDKDSSFIFANKACREIILNSHLDPTFKIDNDFSDDPLSNICIASDRKVMNQNRDIRFIEYGEYKPSIWLDVYKCVLYSPNGEIKGTAGSAININGIIPKWIYEKYKKGHSIEIDKDIILSKEVISEIFKNLK